MRHNMDFTQLKYKWVEWECRQLMSTLFYVNNLIKAGDFTALLQIMDKKLCAKMKL